MGIRFYNLNGFFVKKLALGVYKEAKETEYWLLLLRDSGFLSPKSSESILKDCTELIKMLGSAIATLKRKSPR